MDSMGNQFIDSLVFAAEIGITGMPSLSSIWFTSTEPPFSRTSSIMLSKYHRNVEFHQLHRQIQVSFDICRIYNIDDAARMLVQNEIPGDDLFA